MSVKVQTLSNLWNHAKRSCKLTFHIYYMYVLLITPFSFICIHDVQWIQNVLCFHTVHKICEVLYWISENHNDPAHQYVIIFIGVINVLFFFNYQMNVRTAFWVFSISETELTSFAWGVFCLGLWKTTGFFSFYYNYIFFYQVNLMKWIRDTSL